MRSIGVFCGSQAGRNPAYGEVTREFGEILASRGVTVVYGGGHVGLMGMLADAVLGGGGKVIGVIPQALVDRELAHGSLTRLHVVRTMHERKALMAELSEGFAALPGGFGTADELFEILTWAQLGLHSKPIGILNADGFFDGLLAWLDRAVREGFLRAEHRDQLLVRTGPAELWDALSRATVGPSPRGIGPQDL